MAKVIKVEGISKAYQLGEFGTGTISRDLERFWARMRGKEDPFLKIGEINDRAKKGDSDVVWSLKDINFEVEQGDAVGIIGRNGAGKSTLLKILSRVTAPTAGSVKVKGRIASLLEVGTGFHPELTGKENIYLNGTILGMRKAEIKRKFDEIVDFAGVERYIDTPVKRYSSGMYVRLAFAVAAHLESEILIVDEVLAVGDAEFQKKCLGKMGEVSKGEGRTVLFVSHNMGAVNQLCQKGILLKNGMIGFKGSAENTIREYLKREINNEFLRDKSKGSLAESIKINKLIVNNNLSTEEPSIKPDQDIVIRIEGTCFYDIENFRFNINLSKEGIALLTQYDKTIPYKLKQGPTSAEIIIPKYLLRPGQYIISVGGHTSNYQSAIKDWVYIQDAMTFNVMEIWDEFNDYNNVGLINITNKPTVV
jgi:lipopolysaccharide transport system ATP-binding protein